MNRENRWVLDGEDIIRTDTLEPLLKNQPVTCLVEDLDKQARSRFISNEHHRIGLQIHNEDGLQCQVFKLGAKKWISGTIRYVLEFEPDDSSEILELQASVQNEESIVSSEIEEPLDTIRKLGEQ
jgi:KGK domain